MEKYKCIICGYIYDPEEGDPSDGIEPGISFKDLPDDYICPVCGAGKDEFRDNMTDYSVAVGLSYDLTGILLTTSISRSQNICVVLFQSSLQVYELLLL